MEKPSLHRHGVKHTATPYWAQLGWKGMIGRVDRAYNTGEEIEDEVAGSLRYLGWSRSLRRRVAVDVSGGDLYLLEPTAKLRERIPLPSSGWPDGTVGNQDWNEWADACFAASSLGLADRISDERG